MTPSALFFCHVECPPSIHHCLDAPGAKNTAVNKTDGGPALKVFTFKLGTGCARKGYSIQFSYLASSLVTRVCLLPSLKKNKKGDG